MKAWYGVTLLHYQIIIHPPCHASIQPTIQTQHHHPSIIVISISSCHARDPTNEAWSPNGQWLASASRDQLVMLMEPRTEGVFVWKFCGGTSGAKWSCWLYLHIYIYCIYIYITSMMGLVYLSTFTNKHQLTVGKYNIHGCYGILYTCMHTYPGNPICTKLCALVGSKDP